MVHDALAVEVHGEDGGQLLHEDVGHLQSPHHGPVVLGLQHGGNMAAAQVTCTCRRLAWFLYRINCWGGAFFPE